MIVTGLQFWLITGNSSTTRWGAKEFKCGALRRRGGATNFTLCTSFLIILTSLLYISYAYHCLEYCIYFLLSSLISQCISAKSWSTLKNKANNCWQNIKINSFLSCWVLTNFNNFIIKFCKNWHIVPRVQTQEIRLPVGRSFE